MDAIQASPPAAGQPEAANAGFPISRRTLAAGTAWSVPVIAVAAAAPALAASCGVINFTLDDYTTSATQFDAYGGSFVDVFGTADYESSTTKAVNFAWPDGWSGPSSATLTFDATLNLGTFHITAYCIGPGSPDGSLTATFDSPRAGCLSNDTVLLHRLPFLVGMVWGENLLNTLSVSGGGNLTYATVPGYLDTTTTFV